MTRNVTGQPELLAELERLRRRELELRAHSAELLESLRQAEGERDRLFALSLDMICVLDADTTVQRVSPACQRVVGYQAAELCDRRILDRLLDEDRGAFTGQMNGLRGDGAPRAAAVEVRFLCGDGRLRWMLWSLGVAGAETYFAVARDLTEQREAEARLRHIAQMDPLTRLPNRSLFTDRLEQAITRARRYDGRVGVLFIDLDRFKSVNDELGHDAGDTVLVTMADRMRQCVRGIDTVARLGGDEFVIVLQDVREPHGAALVADRILRTLEAPVLLGGRERQVRASIGVAIYPNDGEDTDSLVRAADGAMYRVKEAGGHDVRFAHLQ